MPYDPAYSKPADWSSDELITATKLQQMVDNTDHNYKYKPECGPDTPNIKIARGIITCSQGTNSVTFSTGADDGDPGFSNAPRVFLSVNDVAGALFGLDRLEAKSITATGFDIGIAWSDDSPPNTGSLDIAWLAIGD